MTQTPIVPLLAARLRRYSFAYTASHDPTVCDDVMVEDYALHMGDFEIRGRDDKYKPAAEKQYRQFPGLGMSVHDLLITPERAALHFSEYGRSVLTGTTAVWSGISLYQWDGDRLTDCRVEQDYYSRRQQLRSGTPNRIDPPAYDPWSGPVEQPNAQVESVAREWLGQGGLAAVAVGSMDDEPVAPPDRIVLGDAQVAILDCFAGAERAAFHASVTGTISGWPGGTAGGAGSAGTAGDAGSAGTAGDAGSAGTAGDAGSAGTAGDAGSAGTAGGAGSVRQSVTVYYAGIVRVRDGRVISARVISDRLAAERRALIS